jgi:sec-independent protein translocase protein TatA
MPGIPELLLILAIVLLVFGAGKIPAIGDALGRGIKNFKRATSGRDEIEVSKHEELDANGKKKDELEAGVRDAEVVDK